MSENEQESEYTPDGVTPCPGCGEPHPARAEGADIDAVVKRFMTDAAGEQYVNVNDIRVFTEVYANAQYAGAVDVTPPNVLRVILGAQNALGLSLDNWLNKAPGVEPDSADGATVPDEIPADWLA